MERKKISRLETEALGNIFSKNSGKIITHILLATTMIPSAAATYVLASCIGTKVFVDAVYCITNCYQGGF